jgi:sugar phosphate permease
MEFIASVSSLERKTLFQCVVFVVTYLSYASYYLTRKPLSVIKSNLVAFGIPVWVLGVYDALFLFVYSLGQFVSGYSSDKLGSKSVVITGLFISSFATASCGIIGLSVFSFSPLTVSILFGISWTINSFGQSLGWSPCIKTMTNWFEKDKRGMIFGFYSTCCVLGSFIGTIIATAMLTVLGWQYSLIIPSIIIFVVGILNFFIWIKEPASYDINIHNNNSCDENNLNIEADSISSESDILNKTDKIDIDEDSNSQKSNNDLDIELTETLRSKDNDSLEININTLSSTTSPSTTTTIIPEEGNIDVNGENFSSLLDSQEELSNVDSNYYKNENLFFLEMIFICLIFFVVKLVMYSVLFWMPYYLHSELNYRYNFYSYFLYYLITLI